MQHRIVRWDGLGGWGKDEAWGGEVVVAGEKGLPVVQDQGEVLIFQRAKLEQKIVFPLNSKWIPLVGFNPVKKSSPRVIRNVLKDSEQGMREVRGHHLQL